jgi:hypothetical protein
MAMEGIKVYVLDVGQGMGNFIQVFGNGLDQPPTNSLIFDLGSEKGSSRAAGPAIIRIVNSLQQMKPPTPPKIDLIVFSHGDKDHWNIFKDLIIRCQRDIPDLKYGDVYYGGTKEQYDSNAGGKKYNIIEALTGKGATDRHQFINAATNFDTRLPDGTWPVTADFYGFKVRVLLANIDKGIALFDKGTNPAFKDKNNVSVVLVCEYAGKHIIFTGDATGLTIQSVNDLIKIRGIQDQVNNTFMLVVPHHGSAETLRYGTNDPFKAAKTFAAYCDANSISASADFRQGFFHPDFEVLNIFCNRKTMKTMPLKIGKTGYIPPNKEKDYPKHIYIAFETKNGVHAWYAYPSEENIFSTAYTKSLFVNWAFILKKDGVMSIERYPSTAIKDVDSSAPVYKVMNYKRGPGSMMGKSPKKGKK